jgi:tetratricopeptide (TPR) repeat protein
MSRLPPSFAKHLKPVPSLGTRSPQAKAKNGITEALNRAKEHVKKGEVGQAKQICIAILARDPNNPDALLLAGSLARGVGDLDLALTYFKGLVALQPNSVDARLNLAAAHGEAREHEEAIKHFEHALALRPESLAALGGLAKSYTAAGKAELSLPLFAKATKLHPAHTAVRLDHADALIALGRMDDAAKLLRENIARGYRVGTSYRSLADTKKFEGEPVELAAILGHLQESELAKESEVSLHHAAGKILNDVGRYEEAVDQFQASKIVAGHGFDLDGYRRRIDTLIATFTPGLLKAKAAFGNPSEIPVFIVGMPRSGTSLTEQICASHPAVFGAGELSKLGVVVRSKGYAHSPNGSIQRSPQAVTAEEARSMSEEYLGFIQRLAPSAARIVDKMPHNFHLVGMIALLFPNAKIIHCTRDPIDNCISCFFSTFNDVHGYNTDLRTLGLYYREYVRLMRHWNVLLPGRIHECRYEAITQDQEGESRRLIDFLGVPWDDACLRFYETERSVTTPSRWQVRQPIYQSSVKRWKKYERKIQPLIDALGDLAET